MLPLNGLPAKDDRPHVTVAPVVDSKMQIGCISIKLFQILVVYFENNLQFKDVRRTSRP
jgi:hypothetical protein